MLINNTVSSYHIPTLCPQWMFPEETPEVIAMGWRERAIPLARGGNIRGFFSRGPGKASIEFESLLEYRVAQALSEVDESCEIISQPLTIHYTSGEKVYKYTPDFLVRFGSLPASLAARGFERLTLIECKPAAKLDACAANLARAYRALRQVTSTPLLVVTNERLHPVSWGRDHD